MHWLCVANKPPQAMHIRIKQTQLGMTALSSAFHSFLELNSNKI